MQRGPEVGRLRAKGRMRRSGQEQMGHGGGEYGQDRLTGLGVVRRCREETWHGGSKDLGSPFPSRSLELFAKRN